MAMRVRDAIVSVLEGHAVGDLIQHLLLESYKPYTSAYSDYLNGKVSLQTAGAELDRWVKTYAHKDASTARKAIRRALDPLLRAKGLEVDFAKDVYKYWRSDYTADYQINVVTRSLRAGSPGGDKLIEVQLLYYPSGIEEYRVTNWGIDAVLGDGAYAKAHKLANAELAKVFSGKRQAVKGYDFATDALAAKKGQKQATAAKAYKYSPLTGSIVWDGTGKHVDLYRFVVKQEFPKHGHKLTVSYANPSKNEVYYLTGQYKPHPDDWVVARMRGGSWTVLKAINRYKTGPQHLQESVLTDILKHYFDIVKKNQKP